MPILHVITNLSKSQIPGDFAAKASKAIASATGRPEAVVQTAIYADAQMSFGGKVDIETATVTLQSIGLTGMPDDRRDTLGKAVEAFIVATLGLKAENFYVCLQAITPSDVFYNRELRSLSK